MSIFTEPKIDCHAHVFDPDNFPYNNNNFYFPSGQEKGTPAQFMQVLDTYGVRNAVLVQPNSGYGFDNRCMLDTIAKSNGRIKGIAVVPNDTGSAELARLKAAGIVGVAFNFALFGAAEYADAADLMKRLAELNMFVQVQVQNDQLPEITPLLRASGARLIFDHCGRPDMFAGLDQAGFKTLLEFGRRGACVKLSGYAKFSRQAYPHADAEPYIRSLVNAFTINRCLWASDWPFLRAEQRVDYGTLLKLAEKWFPDAQDRRKLFWENPCKLFGFDPKLTDIA